MSKTALVITFHLKNEKRRGGFHFWIDTLLKNGYDVDWVTSPVNPSWIFKNTDRENIKNFFTLLSGVYYIKYGHTAKNFAVPFIIPGKIKKILGLSDNSLNYTNWNNLHKKLRDKYDIILLEGVACKYADDIKREYKDSKIIYRPSDIFSTLYNVEDADDIDCNMIQKSNITLCVDENQINYYKNLGVKNDKLKIMRNPLSTDDDIDFLKNYNPVSSNNVVYIGVSFCDLDYIEYAAKLNSNLNFYIIGPFNKKSHDNIVYTDPLTKNEFESYLINAQVAIAPVKPTSKFNLYGYTGKIIMYMKYLLPIVTTNFSNYLGVKGIYNTESEEEFSSRLTELSHMTVDERKKLKNDYLRVLNNFTYNNAEEVFEKELTANINE